ncbi:MAG: AAA family ATPase [Terriglobales bacterium]
MATPLSTTALEALDHIVQDVTTGVIMLCGFPASGKSTGASHLAATLGALVLDKDGFAPALEESIMAELTGNPHDRDSSVYRRVVGPYIYEALIRNALTIGQRQPVVLDAPFLEYVKAAAERGIPLSSYIQTKTNDPVSVTTIWFSSEPEEIRRRMVRRAAARDIPKLSDWPTYRSVVLESEISRDAKATVDTFVFNPDSENISPLG